MRIQFYLRFHTKFGEGLLLSGNSAELGNNDPKKALAMTYLNEEFWEIAVELPDDKIASLRYKYFLQTRDGELIPEASSDRSFDIFKDHCTQLHAVDIWNHAGEYENAFFTTPFQETLFAGNFTKVKSNAVKSATHIFKVKAPLLKKNEVVCLVGGGRVLNDWNTAKPVLLSRESSPSSDGQKKISNWWQINLDLSKEDFPLAYKYGVYNQKEKKFLRFEIGDNRMLYDSASKKKFTVIHDGFVHLPNDEWKGAGVAIPVFSLRSKNSFGVGEFNDLKILANWANTVGLKLIQILPVNDTSATNTWTDSYPYAAISAFALHPIYINLGKVAGKKNAKLVGSVKKKQAELNALDAVDYEQVMKYKLTMLRELYDVLGKETIASEEYQKFFGCNKHWLIPYAAFCYFRDKHGTTDYTQWKTNQVYDEKEISKLSRTNSSALKQIAFHYFVQFHLYTQLKEAADHAHKKGVVLKGDIPIGIYRYGCDAWVRPELYNISLQAGAPPDDFAVKGQNWGFPTYNWKEMQDDGFEWWRKRFEEMSNYFDAFRIDHILGFFRIWSIPLHAVEGIMGHFVPAIPVNVNEFGERGIWFDYFRYTRPYITDDVINESFGSYSERVKKEFIFTNENGNYELEFSLSTQRQVQEYFGKLDDTDENRAIKQGLFDLLSNVILFEIENSGGDEFHFRFGIENTTSFKHLDALTQQKLKDLYVDYFFRRQEEFWRKEAMHKLPYLKNATNMLVCGEDLGMVPHCVPEVMQQLGILSLEIQRMPKELTKEFFNPGEAPYLSVVTPSTHDMSTIRGWWEEDRNKIQRFYNSILGQQGDAPYYCEGWVNRAVVLQHLYSPAMWSIFQLQDLLGMSETLRRENPHEERINEPSNPKHYWRYRMHLTIEELIKQKEFNEELKGYVLHSGR